MLKKILRKTFGVLLKSIGMGIIIAVMIWTVTNYPSEFGGINDLTTGAILG